jgi:two-component sensor histidine kinase
MSILDWLFNPSGLTPHGFCLSWAPGLVGLHVGSDAVIGLAYLSIPLALAVFVAQRPDIKYGWIAYLFVAFIVACGATHLMAIFTLWVPAYGIEGVIKLVTALLSIATAVILWPLLPKLVALPSFAQLEGLNAQLSATNEEHALTAVRLRESEAAVREANIELERRVAERTAELTIANSQLTEALDQRTAALAQRDLLLREVYHRVKNNLQIVDGLLVMKARQLTDSQAQAALLSLRSRIYALGLVHTQLMGSENLRTFDIAPFLKQLVDNIMEGAGQNIRLSIRAMPLEVELDFAIPLGLLVTELVTNSIKHAFQDGAGDIEVVLERGNDGEIVLVVSDNGQGYGDLEPLANGALGGRIIQGLVAQLGGSLTVQSQGGSRSEIRVPEPAQA